MMTILALLPALFLVYVIYKQDKVEKEPKRLIGKIFLFGMLSVIPVVILELLLETVVNLFASEESVFYILIDNFICVALVEEYFKMQAAKKAAWKDKAFDYQFDAIVYCVVAALGFAAVENVFYMIDEGLSLVITRALLAVPGHATDGIVMGYFFGQAKKADFMEDKKRRKKYLRLSVFVPMITHGIYDSALSFDSDWAFMFFILFVIVIDVWAIKFVQKQSKNDAPFVANQEQLTDEINVNDNDMS